MCGIRTNLYFDSQLCKGIYVRGFETAELDFMARFLGAGDVFLDIGANIGVYSLLAAKRVGSTGAVHAFEPHGKTYERLKQNIAESGCRNVVCYNLALSDAEGTACLNASLEGFDAWNSLSQPTRGSAFLAESVRTLTLDGFCSKHGLSVEAITMIKIDVEGWESHVLTGAERLLLQARAPVLQVEFSDRACRQTGGSLDSLASQILRLGYSLYTYDIPRKRLTRIRNISDLLSENALCLKDAQRVACRSAITIAS